MEIYSPYNAEGKNIFGASPFLEGIVIRNMDTDVVTVHSAASKEYWERKEHFKGNYPFEAYVFKNSKLSNNVIHHNQNGCNGTYIV